MPNLSRAAAIGERHESLEMVIRRSVFNYMTPLFTLTLPEYTSAFRPNELQALARGANRLFGYASV